MQTGRKTITNARDIVKYFTTLFLDRLNGIKNNRLKTNTSKAIIKFTHILMPVYKTANIAGGIITPEITPYKAPARREKTRKQSAYFKPFLK